MSEKTLGQIAESAYERYRFETAVGPPPQHPTTKFKVGDEVFFKRDGGVYMDEVLNIKQIVTAKSNGVAHGIENAMTRAEAAEWVMNGGQK